MIAPTQIVMLDFPPCELPEFMVALTAALPGAVWFSTVIHQPGCPLRDLRLDTADPPDALAYSCTCDVAEVVLIKRLLPVDP